MARTFSILLLIFASLFSSKLHADFGLTWDPPSTAQLRLDSAEAAFSIRFVSPRDQELRAVSLYCADAQKSPLFNVQVEDDRDGHPSGKPLASASWVPRQASWSTLALAGVTLKKGATYHLVVSHNDQRGGVHSVGRIGAGYYASFAALSPAAGGNESSVTLLLRRGKGWVSSALIPVFILQAGDGILAGQSYVEPFAAGVFGGETGSVPAQVLHFNCGSTVSSLRAKVRAVGHPKAPLRLHIYSHNYMTHQTHLLYQGDFTTVDLSTAWSWKTLLLPETAPKSFAPECYYFAFVAEGGRAEGAGCEDCYEVFGLRTRPGASGAMDLTFDAGAHRSRASVRGVDGVWEDDFDADLNVVTVGSYCEPREISNATPLLPSYSPPLDLMRGAFP
ncbi:MAG: hypothetical protein V4498_10145 [candidate division FCPU426 bacterium]